MAELPLTVVVTLMVHRSNQIEGHTEKHWKIQNSKFNLKSNMYFNGITLLFVLLKLFGDGKIHLKAEYTI